MSTTSKQGLNREAQATLLRVRTGPERPEDNLKELTWDSQREGQKKKRERERTFPQKALTQGTLRPGHRTRTE